MNKVIPFLEIMNNMMIFTVTVNDIISTIWIILFVILFIYFYNNLFDDYN